MNAGQVIALWRLRVDDVLEDYSWTPAEAMAYLVAAQREAAERALLIEDETTPDVCHIDGVADTATYDLHPSIIEVRTATWDGRFLDGVGIDYLRDRFPGGWKQLTGRPTMFLDPQQKQITLVRKPVADGDIDLNVYRYPLVDPTELESALEIPARCHPDLVDYMEHLAYLKPDTQTFDVDQATLAEARFTKKFGPKIDWATRRTQRARTRNQVAMNPGW